ncbi:hypothetical protein [Sorangium sp. So ce385]|uniref:hypothetical protein n=1 Tax=Sorangium sp. So ce385 TaxID=3133308 RepID=UPI003F5B5987
MSHRGPDAGEPLDLETFARVSAELEAGGATREEVLGRHALDGSRWERAAVFWSRRLADDAAADGPLAEAFAGALTPARAALGAPAMSPEDWAALTLDIAERGVGAALTARGLAAPVYFRLAKRWAEALPRDPALAARYTRALYALGRR